MATAETLLKTGEVSAMIKQGFISSSPSHLPSSPSSSPPPSTHHPSPPLTPIPSPNNKTLFQMITQETNPHTDPPASDHCRRRIRVQERISQILSGEKPSWGKPDVELLISSNDGFRVSMEVHRRVLAAKSRFFKENLGRKGGVVEICECDDVEVYVEVVALMYCGDLRRRLAVAGEDIGRVIGLLKVSVAIIFEDGIAACLEYLEAIPWSEDQEEEVISVLNHLHLREPLTEVLQRVMVEPSSPSRADAIFLQLLSGVLQAKDEKARRDMKTLISGLLREDSIKNNNNVERLNVSRETLYHLCHKCLNSLHLCLSEAANMDENRRDRGNLMGEIAREADNLHWLAEILINKKSADEFVMLWADQTQLASLHSKIPCMYRFEVSRITAQLCITIGKGDILVSKDAKSALLNTWLEALYNDFSWMRRACRTLDKKMVEDGLCRTILTLPMAQQQSILLRWFDRFLKKGDDCPNIQRAFEVWWRRAFVRRYDGDRDQSPLQIAVSDYST